MHTTADCPFWEEMFEVTPAQIPQTVRWQAVNAFKRAGVKVTPQAMEWRTNRLDRTRSKGRTYAARYEELFFGHMN
jgi:hypothetical protein